MLTSEQIPSGITAEQSLLAATKQPAVQSVDAQVDEETQSVNYDEHYRGWPNAIGFNYHQDHPIPAECKVTGKIPSWASGTLLRTGPNSYQVPAKDSKEKGITLSHWFDGFTRLHKFTITPESADQDSGCKVKYQSRTQVDELIERARKTGRLNNISFGQKRDPCDTFYQKVKSSFFSGAPTADAGENTGVTIQKLPGEAGNSGGALPAKMMTATDAHSLKTFDTETLEPLGVTMQDKLHPDLKGPMSAAHPAKDPKTGDWYNFNLVLGARQTYRIFHTKADGSGTRILATINGFKGAYIHSLFLTEHFVILCIWPAYYVAGGAKMLWERNILDALEFDESAKTEWLLVDRSGEKGVVARFQSDPFFCYHTINAWEEAESSADGKKVKITADLCEFPNIDTIHHLYYDQLLSNNLNETSRKAMLEGQKLRLNIVRYEMESIDLDYANSTAAPQLAKKLPAGPAKRTVIIPHGDAGDLPQINPRFRGMRHRYVYSVVNRGLSTFFDAIAKGDTENGTSKLWSRQNQTPGEPIFIARPGGSDEDDGILLTVVLDGDRGKSYLLCLDAKTMGEVGRADCGHPVGFGFHGTHISHGF